MNNNTQALPLPIDQWHSSLNHIVDDMAGRPLNVHRLMACNPDLLKAWWDFRNYSVAGGSLGKRNAELVILRVAVHMQSWYEWASHADRALACGLSLEEIERVKDNPGSPQWDASERLLLTAADELVSHHRISAATRTQLGEFYNVKQIMDIIAIQGMYVILGCMINTWGLELDPHIESTLPETISRETFILD